MLQLPDHWIWDFWFADTGTEYHVFFLRASRALIDPERRHKRASIGHAVSTDLRTWTLLADALVPSDEPAFDDNATWTGSIVRDETGVWRMFYTGISRQDGGRIQRIGMATSTDLLVWEKDPAGPICVSDPRWYEADPASSGEVAWRDPWVFADPKGGGWHMLITAKSVTGEPGDRGVVGHATSTDLHSWQIGPPLSAPGSGFVHCEVFQVEQIDGRPVLIFSCPRTELTPRMRRTWGQGGIWVVPADTVIGPFDLDRATLLLGQTHYVGRLIRDRTGQWVMLAFFYEDTAGRFIGGLCDPTPVGWRDNKFVLLDGPDHLVGSS